MINPHYREMLNAKNMIRELSEFAAKRAGEVGVENVFDFSLGNPSVPCPDSYTEAVINLYREADPMAIHGYSPTLGIPSVKAAVAESLSRRFGLPYTPALIFPTSGAAGALAHALRAVTVPGEEVLVQAPFFSEYVPYIAETGAKLVTIPADTKVFQMNLEALTEQISERTAAVLINTPNNPAGTVYSEATLTAVARILDDAQKKYGHEIFLISDEPYREIVFDGRACPYPAAFYDNTLTCYSFSKSLSVPGERIGYVAVSPRAKDAETLAVMMGQISRGIGHNCPASTAMLAMAACVDDTSDLSVYETNAGLLYDAFRELDFEVVRPEGTFYIFPKALEEDAVQFCRKARDYDLIFVPSDGFGVRGYFRLAYCVDTDRVERAIPVLQKFVREIYGRG